METIKKVISLEQYKSRFNHKTPFINHDGIITPVTENNWGEIPCDYYFMKLDKCPFAKIINKLPLVSGINIKSSEEKVISNEYCFRYKTMLYWYNWINEYGKKCSYYKLCKRGAEYMWRELNYELEMGDFFVDDYNLNLKKINSLTYIPNNFENYSIGDIIEVNGEADILNDIFRVSDDDTRYELVVLRFIKGIFNSNNIHPNLSIPFVDIPVHITQSIDNLGLLTSTAKVWEPRKTYMIDDIILYNGNTYILRDGDSIGLVELTGGLNETFIAYIEDKSGGTLYYKFIEIKTSTKGKTLDEIIGEITEDKTPEEVVYEVENNKRVRKNVYYDKSEGLYKFYLPYKCHKAKMDKKTGEFIFNTIFWKPNKKNADIFNVNDSGIILDGLLSGETFNSRFIKTTSDSKLTSLRRFKKSVDDDGNILPFILNDSKTVDTELPYSVGIYNVYMGPNDTFRGDVMTDISISTEKNNQFLSISYIGSGKTSINTTFYKNIDGQNENKITLPNIETGYTITETTLYKWEEVNKTTERDENIELIDTLPNAEEKYLDLFFQATSYTDSIMYYVTYKCVKDKISVNYSGETKNKVYITPSMLMLGDYGLTSSKGTIDFSYIKDCFLIYNSKGDTSLKNYDYQTGLIYNEGYNYEISVGAINLNNGEYFEKKEDGGHTYKLYPHELEDGDVVAGDIDDIDTSQPNIYNKIGNIYCERVNGEVIGYKRLLSEYNFIDIDFDSEIYEVTSTDIENLKKNTILSSIEYSLKSITEDDFQKDYVIKDEYTIGLEDVIEEIDIDIERGISSSFERHHILCEIKSLGDLENYRNNLFKI